MPLPSFDGDRMVIRRQPPGPLPDAFPKLACIALDEDIQFVAVLNVRWTGRGEQFALAGEGLFGAWIERNGVGELAGIAGVMRDPYLSEPDIARLRHVYVAPQYRGRGVAEALVRACLEQARGQFRIMRLNAIAGNAARIYERLGFRPVTDGQRATHILTMGD